MTSEKLTAEDIVQNVFLKLFENYKKIQNKDKIDIWVFKTAKFEVYNFYRGKKTKADQFGVSDIENVEIESNLDIADIIEIHELRELILTELENIPVEQKDVFVLKEFGELNYNEISRVLDLTEELVKSRLFLARKKLISRISKILK